MFKDPSGVGCLDAGGQHRQHQDPQILKGDDDELHTEEKDLKLAQSKFL